MRTTVYVAFKGVDYCAGPTVVTLAVYDEQHLERLHREVSAVVDGSKQPEEWLAADPESYKEIVAGRVDWEEVTVRLAPNTKERELKGLLLTKILSALSRLASARGLSVYNNLEVVSYDQKLLEHIQHSARDFLVREPLAKDVTQLTVIGWYAQTQYTRLLESEFSKELRIYSVQDLGSKPEPEHIDMLLKVGPSPLFHRGRTVRNLPKLLASAIRNGELNEYYNQYFKSPPSWWFTLFPTTAFHTSKLSEQESIRLCARQREGQKAYKFILSGPDKLSPTARHTTLEPDCQLSLFELCPQWLINHEQRVRYRRVPELSSRTEGEKPRRENLIGWNPAMPDGREVAKALKC
jgi:hypothetical protein